MPCIKSSRAPWLRKQRDSSMLPVGFVRALRANKPSRAVLGTLMRIMLPPWIGILLMVFVLQNSVSSQNGVAVLFLFWFGFGVLTDLFFQSVARFELRKGIRRILSEPSRAIE